MARVGPAIGLAEAFDAIANDKAAIVSDLARSESNAHAPDEFTSVDNAVALARAILLYFSAEFDEEPSPA